MKKSDGDLGISIKGRPTLGDMAKLLKAQEGLLYGIDAEVNGTRKFDWEITQFFRRGDWFTVRVRAIPKQPRRRRGPAHPTLEDAPKGEA